jgi:hypothetical protein
VKLLILLILVIIWIILFPVWPHSRRWSYWPAYLFGLLVVLATAYLQTMRA